METVEGTWLFLHDYERNTWLSLPYTVKKVLHYVRVYITLELVAVIKYWIAEYTVLLILYNVFSIMATKRKIIFLHCLM